MDNRNRSIDKKRVKFVARKIDEAESQLRGLYENGIVNGDGLYMSASRKIRSLKNELKFLMAPPSDNTPGWEG